MKLSRKEALLRATRQCMVEKGINRVTMKMVANRANVSTGLLYHYFTNKENLLLEALTTKENELQNELKEQLSRCTSASKKLITYVEYLLPGEAQRQMWQFWFEVRAHAARDGKVSAVCQDAYFQWRSIRESILNEGVDAGEFSNINVREMGEMLGALMEGLARRALLINYLSESEVRSIMQKAIAYLKNPSIQASESTELPGRRVFPLT